MRKPIDNLFSAWRDLNSEAYVAQWAPDAVKVDLKAGTTKTMEQLASDRRRLFPQISRVQVDYRSQFDQVRDGTAFFDVSYRLKLHYKSGRTFTESACEGYEVRQFVRGWLITRNEDYKPCAVGR
jgi:hypothetical protein